jgi:hypothetical protein
MRFYKLAVKTVLCLVFIFTFCGCASFAPIVKTEDMPDKSISYIYGCFKQIKPSDKLRTQSGIIALAIINNNTNNEYKIRFGWDEDVLCVAVEPGCYHISKWYSYDCFGSEKLMEQDISDHIDNNNFCLEGGMAYYLGDYVSRFEHGQLFLTHRYVHILDVPKDNYQENTELFNKLYPAFGSLIKKKIFSGNIFKDEFNKAHILDNTTTTTIILVP